MTTSDTVIDKISVKVEILMEPFYFGESPRLLFACYYPPQGNIMRNCGVVICHPMGQEYIRSHRAFVQLAHHLSALDYPVLRFDFSGCGDSAGNSEQGSIRLWIKEIAAAVEELKTGCNLQNMCLIGMRLGATLALVAASETCEVDGIVLWDPVTRGGDYLEELRGMHSQWLSNAFVGAQPLGVDRGMEEVLGFPVTEALAQELLSVDTLALPIGSARNALLVESKPMASNGELMDKLTNDGMHIDYKHISSSQVWIKATDEIGTAQESVPMRILHGIGEWIMRRMG